MEILEFGNKEKEKIILIHGFQNPYQIWDKYIEHYKNDYHIIIPILRGHNPNIEDDFISFDDILIDIEKYYISRYGHEVYAIYGLSMGGILATMLWESKNLNIKKIILDSSPLVSFNKLILYFLEKQYLMLTHKIQQRNKRIVNKAIKNIIPRDKLDVFLALMDNMSDITIRNYIREVSRYKLPNNINIDTEIYYFHGTRLIGEILAMKTARYIKKYYKSSKIIRFKGKGHCENSLFNPSIMIEELDRILYC